MKEKIKDWIEWHEIEIKFGIGLMLGTISVIALVIFSVILEDKKDNKIWNNGYCECGGKYEYEQAVGTRYGTDYIYKCTKCDKRIQIDKIR